MPGLRIIIISLVLGVCQVGNALGQVRTSADEILNAWIAASLVFPENETDSASSWPLGVSVYRVHPRFEAPNGLPPVLGTLPTTLLGSLFLISNNTESGCDLDLLAKELSGARSESQRLGQEALVSGFSEHFAVCFNGGLGGTLPIHHTVLVWSGGQILAYVQCDTRSCTLHYLPPLPSTPQDKIVGLKVSIISNQHFNELIEDPNGVIQRVLDTAGFDDAVYERPSIPLVQSITQQALDYPTGLQR